ncbi:hypothetical protein MMC11_000923 [Xylographa trunciseda]|nr:hypothetical protein [Xylographa trunciseda]
MAPSTLNPPVLDTYQAVVAEFCEFLTVAVHTILYERDIYPRASFISARKYNYPVRQNRHPKVCKWIQDAVAAVEAELLKGTISRTSLIIYTPTSTPIERFVFSTAHFPLVARNEALTTLEVPDPDAPAAPLPTTTATNNPLPIPPPQPPVPLINLHSQFRALFTRLSTLTASLAPLPPDCTFTLAIELHDRTVRRPDGDFAGQPPLSANSPWIAAEPGLQPLEPGEVAATASSADTGGSSSHGLGSSGEATGSGSGSASGSGSHGKGKERESAAGYVSQKGKYLGGLRTVPVRSVEAGPFVMEVWVEEGRGKAEAVREAQRQRELEREMGFGEEEEEEEEGG